MAVETTSTSGPRVWRWRYGCALAVLALTWGGAASAVGGAVGLAGDDEVVWVYQTRPNDAGDGQLIHFAFMPLEKSGGRFIPLQQRDTAGAPHKMAVRGQRLHVFFADGTHLAFAPVPRSITPRESRSWERTLPNSAVPTVVAGDSGLGVLYAVVSGKTAALLKSGSPRASTQPVADGTVSEADDGPMPTTQAAPARFGLVRFEGGQWWRDRDVPEAFDEQTGCYLASSNGVCDLYFTRPSDPGATWFMRSDDGAWSTVERVGAVPWDKFAACGVVAGEAVVVLRHSNRLEVLVRDATGWRSRAEIERLTGMGWAESTVPAVGMAGELVAAAWGAEGGGVRAGLWDLDGGVVAEASDVEALAELPKAPISYELQLLIPYAILAFTMLFVFHRRRLALLNEASLPADLAPASHGRRLAAILLDAVISAPATFPVVFSWLRQQIGDGLTLKSDFETAMANTSWEFYWRWMVGLGIFIAYCVLFETLRGATLGKLIVGCRVVREDGGRCGFGAIVARNVLRVVEFYPRLAFAPVLILVVLTRNRQRLGDLVARSMVVESKRPLDVTVGGG